MNEIDQQRAFYTRTSAQYDQSHVNPKEPEHDVALNVLVGLAHYHRYESFLDVGCGTGRGVSELIRRFPEARVMGVEPVEALREIAHGKGLPKGVVVAGDATRLEFPDSAFDCVAAFGILHHIRQPRVAIAEMLRVARRGVFLSDLNNFGCGSKLQRGFAQTINALGLWKVFQLIKTLGKGYKYSEGDGIHYSYSLFNDLAYLRRECQEVYLINTDGQGGSPYHDCCHVALLAVKRTSALGARYFAR